MCFQYLRTTTWLQTEIKAIMRNQTIINKSTSDNKKIMKTIHRKHSECTAVQLLVIKCTIYELSLTNANISKTKRICFSKKNWK